MQDIYVFLSFLSMHNLIELIEYSNIYSNVLENFWQYYRDEQNDNITESESFKFKEKIAGKTRYDDNKKTCWNDSAIKCLDNFWIVLEMPLINCKINLILTISFLQLKIKKLK